MMFKLGDRVKFSGETKVNGMFGTVTNAEVKYLYFHNMETQPTIEILWDKYPEKPARPPLSYVRPATKLEQALL